MDTQPRKKPRRPPTCSECGEVGHSRKAHRDTFNSPRRCHVCKQMLPAEEFRPMTRTIDGVPRRRRHTSATIAPAPTAGGRMRATKSVPFAERRDAPGATIPDTSCRDQRSAPNCETVKPPEEFGSRRRTRNGKTTKELHTPPLHGLVQAGYQVAISCPPVGCQDEEQEG